MSKKILIPILVVLIFGAGIWFMYNGTNTPATEEPGTTEEETEEEAADDVHDTHDVVLSEQNNSGESGTAFLEDLGDGTTRVTISSEGALVGVGPQPAHIHSGTCEDLGGVEYALENVVNGSSQTVVNVSLDELLAGTFAINLHMSPQEAGIYTSCGNL